MLAALLASISSAFWGGSDFLAGLASRKTGALRVSVWSYVTASIVSVITFFVVPSFFNTAAVLAGLVAAVGSAIGFVTFYAALSLAPMGIVSAIVAASQAMVPIVIGPVVKSEQIGAVGWAGVVLAAAGAVIVGSAEGVDGKVKGRAVLLAIVSGVTFALAVVALDWAPVETGMTAPTVEMLVGLLVIVVFYFLVKKIPVLTSWAVSLELFRVGDGIPARDVRNAKFLGYFAGAVQGLANLAMMFALWGGSLTVVGVIVCLYPVVTVILAWLFLGEKLKVLHLAGIALALTGAVLLALV